MFSHMVSINVLLFSPIKLNESFDCIRKKIKVKIKFFSKNVMMMSKM